MQKQIRSIAIVTVGIAVSCSRSSAQCGPSVHDVVFVPDGSFLLGGFGPHQLLDGDTLMLAKGGFSIIAPQPGVVDIAAMLRRNGDGWTLEQHLALPFSAGTKSFYTEVALQDSLAAVANYAEKDDGGAVYIFERITSGLVAPEWQNVQVLRPLADETQGYFGRSVEFSGEWLFIGHPGTDAAPDDAASLHVYRRTLGKYERVQTLRPDAFDVTAGWEVQRFGAQASASGHRLLVGAPGLPPNGIGWVGYFEQVDEEWIPVARLSHPDPSTGGNFGDVMDLEGDRAVIAAPHASNFHGRVWVYSFVDGEWMIETELPSEALDLPNAPTSGFGDDVDLAVDRIAVSAWDPRDGGIVVFDRVGNSFVPTQTIYGHLLQHPDLVRPMLGSGVLFDGDMILAMNWASASTGGPNPYNQPFAALVIDPSDSALTIESHPQSVQTFEGDTVRFSIEASSDSTLQYLWFRNGTSALSDSGPFSGTRTPTLTITNAGFIHAGDYSCRISCIAADIYSNPATLTIAERACLGDANGDRLVNMVDVSTTLTLWGEDYRPNTGPGDADRNGIVEFRDISAIMAQFGSPCTLIR